MPQKAKAFVANLYHHVPVLDSGARGSTITFTKRGIGDVLLDWENEAHLALKEAPGQYEIVYPSRSILAEPPVALVDKNVDRHKSRAAAEAFLNFLYTPEAQEIEAKDFYRPRNPRILAKYKGQFPDHSAGHGGRRFRRLGQGAGHPFRRRRRVRPDLPAGRNHNLSAIATGAFAGPQRPRHVLPGLRPVAGVHAFLSDGHRADPAAGAGAPGPSSLGLDGFWTAISTPRVLASLRLSFGMASLAAAIDSVFGFIIAWVLVRYRFPGKRLLDAVIDLPFALPTAVAGIALSTLYAPNGWIGAPLAGIRHPHRLHALGRAGGDDFHRPALRRAHACSRC